MNATNCNQFACLFSLLLIATGVQAQYRCDAPATRVDRGACEAAKEGPDTLRRYIQRIKPIESLQFSDYVNDATLVAWDARERASKVTKSVDEPVASRR